MIKAGVTNTKLFDLYKILLKDLLSTIITLQSIIIGLNIITMQDQHIIEKKLQSLSIRIEYLTVSPSKIAVRNNSQQVQQEDLQCNISWVISQILLNLTFTKKSKSTFNKIITSYNKRLKTKLKIDDFADICWISEIFEEILVPEHIVNLLNAKNIDIPLIYQDRFNCLKLYYESCIKNQKPYISDIILDGIINQYGSSYLNIKFLIDSGILAQNSKAKIYFYLSNNDYSRTLSDRIIANLWLSLMGNIESEVCITERLISIIYRSNINLSQNIKQLSHNNGLSIVGEHAYQLLINQSDLKNSKSEVKKISLNFGNDSRFPQFELQPPEIDFGNLSILELIQQITILSQCHFRLSGAPSRNDFVSFMLQILAHTDSYGINKINTKSLLKLLQDTSQPFVVWQLYMLLKNQLQSFIPYLLTTPGLIAIAFELIDEIVIRSEILVGQDDMHKQIQETLDIKNQLWLELFDLILEQIPSTTSHSTDYMFMATILSQLANKLFRKINFTSHGNNREHFSLKDRYARALDKLNKVRQNIPHYVAIPLQRGNLILSYVLRDMLQHYIGVISDVNIIIDRGIRLSSGDFYFGIDLIKSANVFVNTNEGSAQLSEIQPLKNQLITAYFNLLIIFYTADQNHPKIKEISMGFETGFEMINWGYLYMQLYSAGYIDNLDTQINNSLKFDINISPGETYPTRNMIHQQKLKIYVKSLMLAFISINKNKLDYITPNNQLDTFLEKLKLLILGYAIKYSLNDPQDEQIDIFNEGFFILGNSIYYKPLKLLLNESLEYFDKPTQISFVGQFIDKTQDIGRILSISNILNDSEINKIISTRLKNIKLINFFRTVSFITEIQQALIEAVNSEHFWDKFAEPLIKMVETHFKHRKADQNSIVSLFEIKLLLAFKQKNFKKLSDINPPKEKNQSNEIYHITLNLKIFYIALYNIYYEKNYPKAIAELNVLLNHNPCNVTYALHRYHAQTMQAIRNNMDKSKFDQAYLDWENFINSINGTQTPISTKHYYQNLLELALVDSLCYFIVNNDTKKFDQTLNRLSNRYKFHEDILPIIYNFYVDRDLHTLGFNYLTAAQKYFSGFGKEIPNSILQLSSDDSIMMTKHREIWASICTQLPDTIPKIAPPNLNGQTQLNEFIFKEIFQAASILLHKRAAIFNLDENCYNDLLMSMLELRFAAWGWLILDQARTGISETGKQAGEADIIIKSGSSRIAIVEALILKRKNIIEVRKHVLKCFKYDNLTPRYYMVIYYKGKSQDCDNHWAKYKSDVLSLQFPKKVSILQKNDVLKFYDLTTFTNNNRDIKAGKTQHKSGVEMFHLMINLGYTH